MFKLSFPLHNEHIGITVNIIRLLRILFTKAEHRSDHHFYVILRFSLLQISKLVHRVYFILCWDKFCF